MIRQLTRIAAAVILLALPAAAIEVQEVTSPGGIEAWLVEDHSIPFTALSIQFQGGASMDAKGKSGATMLMAATLEEGAGERDATEFAEALETLGARFSFDAHDDAVVVTARILTENRDASAVLLRDALVSPRFDKSAVDRVRAQLLAIIRADANNPQVLAQEALSRALWGDHPYGAPVNGTSESVAALTPDDLRAAKDRVLARDRLVVAAAGDISPAELGKLLDRVLGKLPAEASAPLPPKAEYQAGGGVQIIDWDSPQTVVAFATPSIPMDDPDYFPLLVLNHVLGGGGFSSRLMDELREKRGLTYGAYTGLATRLFGDSWQGGFAADNGKTAEAVQLTREVWAEMAGGITEAELRDAKTYLTGEYPLRFDGNRKIAGILAGMQLMGMPRDYINTRNDRVEAVTAEDVARVARRLLDADALNFVLVGQPEGITEAP